MIAIISTAAAKFMDRLGKYAVRAAFDQATEITGQRTKKSSAERYQSAFKDCPSEGSDLRSEAQRSAKG
jgi:hypothetical protein